MSVVRGADPAILGSTRSTGQLLQDHGACFKTRPSGAGRADGGIVGEAFVYALVGGLGLTVVLALAGIAAPFLVRRDDAGGAPRPADAAV